MSETIQKPPGDVIPAESIKVPVDTLNNPAAFVKDLDTMPTARRAKEVYGVSPDNIKKFQKGAKLSNERLKELRFDPILEHCKLYWKLEAELKRQEEMRDGTKVFLRPDGKEAKYSPDVHIAVYDRLRQIASELLRYGYGRVPEGIDLSLINNLPGLTINLTKKGDVFEPDNLEASNVNKPTSGTI